MDLILTPKQKQLIEDYADVDEILWGGQAGVGKTEVLLTFSLMRRLQCPGSVGIIFRRKFTDLDKSVIRKAQMDSYAMVFNTTCLECGKKLILNSDKAKVFDTSECTCQVAKPKDITKRERLLIRPAWEAFGAKWNGEKRKYVFPNGSIQEFGYIDKEDDLINYRSGEWCEACFDELTSFPFDWYQTIKGRGRPRGDWKFLMRSATNPGGPGHKQVKEYFVDVAKDEIYKIYDKELMGYRTRLFMTACLDDNNIYQTYFPEQFRNYKALLSDLPETEKQHQKFGNWEFNPDSAFMELDKRVQGVKTEVPVPDWAEIMMAYDWGFGAPFCIQWFWIDHDGRMWMFKEWYGGVKVGPDTYKGLRMADSQVAAKILEREKEWGLEDRRIMRVATPDCFSKKPDTRGGGQGPSTAETFAKQGVYLIPGDSGRRAGIAQFRERLKKPIDSLPMLMIYESCIHFWRTVPQLGLDETFEDVDQNGQDDHCYDCCKVGIMARPITPQQEKPNESLFHKVLRKVTSFKKRDDDVMEEIYD